jgi:hypothetical protein
MDTTCAGGQGDFTPEFGCSCATGYFGNACHLTEDEVDMFGKPGVVIGLTILAVCALGVLVYSTRGCCSRSCVCCKAQQGDVVEHIEMNGGGGALSPPLQFIQRGNWIDADDISSDDV